MVDSGVISLRVSKAKKVYLENDGENAVLDHVNMMVFKNEIYVLIGPSGCGKTTLLSCVLGMTKLDSGVIKFSDEFKSKTQIGFMPQELSLSKRLTIRELFFFFGRIYGLKEKKIQARLDSLMDLVEMTNLDDTIENCSGGEQRRISFAISMIHEPNFLILDEPTVGLDSLLREKIWNYLITETAAKNLTVIVTTHYIEHAMHANRIGFLRKGRLLYESGPYQALKNLECQNLDEVFLKLCEIPLNDEKLETDECCDQPKFKNTSNQRIFKRRLKALITRNYIQNSRSMFLFYLIVPFCSLILFHLTVDCVLYGLNVGIVNDDVSSPKECHQIRKTCEGKISCTFLQFFDDDKIIGKKFYKNLQEAFRDLESHKINGIIHFPLNFTESFRVQNEDNFDSPLDEGDFNVHLDYQNFHEKNFLTSRIFETYEKFIGNVSKDFELEENLLQSPVKTFLLYESSKTGFRESFGTNMAVFTLITFCAIATSMSCLDDRMDGSWIRIIFAEVSPVQIVLSHFIFDLVASIIPNIQVFFFVTYFLRINVRGSYVTTSLILFLSSTTGLTFGLLNSLLAKSSVAAIHVLELLCLLALYISGSSWPLEGMPEPLQYFAKMFPMTLPAVSLRNVLFKGTSISDPSVITGLVILVAWIVGMMLLCLIVLRKKM